MGSNPKREMDSKGRHQRFSMIQLWSYLILAVKVKAHGLRKKYEIRSNLQNYRGWSSISCFDLRSNLGQRPLLLLLEIRCLQKRCLLVIVGRICSQAAEEVSPAPICCGWNMELFFFSNGTIIGKPWVIWENPYKCRCFLVGNLSIIMNGDFTIAKGIL